MLKKRIIANVLVFAMLLSIVQPVYAITETKYMLNNGETEVTETEEAHTKYINETESDDTEDEVDDTVAPYSLPDGFEIISDPETVSLTVDQAVSYGLEHSSVIAYFENQVDHAIVTVSINEEIYDDFDDAEYDLYDAEDLIEDAEDELTESQEDLDDAYDLYDEDLAPDDIYYDGELVVEAGEDISESVEDFYDDIVDAYTTYFMSAYSCDEDTAEDYAEDYVEDEYGTYDEVLEMVYEEIEEELDGYQDDIDDGNTAVDEAWISYDVGEYEYEDAISTASDEIDDILGYNNPVSYDDIDDLGNLLVTVAGVNLDVTRYAKGIYRNQIAMLIKSNYYDALYAKKVVELKEVAMARGEEQYNAVKLSYDNGMKSKDDYLLSKMYYDGTVIALRLAEAEYNNAMYELKENINISMDTELELTDSLIYEVTEEDLEAGLKSGMTNRIEMQQVLGTLMLQELNQEILKTMYTKLSDERSNELVEAEILVEEAEIALEQVRQQVSSEIYQSYELMAATGDMLETSKDLVANAEEVLEIAQLKYEQGYGSDNSLLTSLNLESSSATMIEVLAAEENLASMEAQVAQIYYSYTMARIKYLNDAGILVYK